MPEAASFLSLLHIVPIDTAIGKAGGLYRREYGRSHGVGLADAILAATAEAENAELKTLNAKHYPMFKNLKPAYKNKRPIWALLDNHAHFLFRSGPIPLSVLMSYLLTGYAGWFNQKGTI